MLITSNANDQTLTGRVTQFIDGDTLDLSDKRIRLFAIDTPENIPSCIVSDVNTYSCGDSATIYLKSLVQQNDIHCEGDEIDAYKRFLATCFVGQLNMKKQLVIADWPVAFLKYDKRYLSLEKDAKLQKRGMWQGVFQRPSEFRSLKWQEAGQGRAGQGDDTMEPGYPIKREYQSKRRKTLSYAVGKSRLYKDENHFK